MFWSGFIVGSGVTLVTVIIYSCLVVASRADDQMEQEIENLNK